MNSNIINKEIVVGTKVKANDSSMYEGLEGVVTEIREGENKDTDNIGRDIYVCFNEPETADIMCKVEDNYSELLGEVVDFNEIAIDEVIMADEMLDII